MCTKVILLKRIEFTRYRLSSHNLKVETGRWGRVARENHTCLCTVGGVQDEYHCIFQCDWTRHLRTKYSIGSQSLEDLYHDLNVETLCDLFYELNIITI